MSDPITTLRVMTSTDLEVRRAHAPTALPVSGTDVPADMETMWRMSEALCKASVVPKHLQGNPSNVLAVMMEARALDVPMAVAWRNFYMVDGNVTVSAALARTLAPRSGWQVLMHDLSNESASCTIVRPNGERCETITYTIADAKTAKLVDKKNWQTGAKGMLIARASKLAITTHCPGVVNGMPVAADGEDAASQAAPNVTVTQVSLAVPAEQAPVAVIKSAKHYVQLASGATSFEGPDGLREIRRQADDDGVLDVIIADDGATVMDYLNERAALIGNTADGQKADDVERLPCGCSTEHLVIKGVHAPGCTA